MMKTTKKKIKTKTITNNFYAGCQVLTARVDNIRFG